VLEVVGSDIEMGGLERPGFVEAMDMTAVVVVAGMSLNGV
jgi:hypothetical protein